MFWDCVIVSTLINICQAFYTNCIGDNVNPSHIVLSLTLLQTER